MQQYCGSVTHMGGVGKLRTWKGLIYSLYKNEYRNVKLTETAIRKGLR
jgi:hypothetical protein